uniref:Uncharacterized protein n=1 Tax=Ditylenchus dipsaci TaxID=166011 RepID=A0A915CVL2_9BILA
MFVCKFPDHAHPGVYSCPAIKEQITKTRLPDRFARRSRRSRPSKVRAAWTEDSDKYTNREAEANTREKDGHTAQLSLEDVEALYEDNRAIPEEEDIPYCSGFGKQEVPKKDGEAGEMEWQFFLIFTTPRLMKKQHGSLIIQTNATYKPTCSAIRCS